jgi:hypothetical protein
MSVRTSVRSLLSAVTNPADPVLRCSIVSARIVSLRIVSVLIIGGWMMSVRRIEAPARALS